MLRAATSACRADAWIGLAQTSPRRADFPERPVTIMVSARGRSGMDVLVRLMPTSCRKP